MYRRGIFFKFLILLSLLGALQTMDVRSRERRNGAVTLSDRPKVSRIQAPSLTFLVMRPGGISLFQTTFPRLSNTYSGVLVSHFARYHLTLTLS